MNHDLTGETLIVINLKSPPFAHQSRPPLLLHLRLAHPRHDIAIRGWASQEPIVARCLEKVDRFRLDVIGKIFERMGFTGDELLVRTRTFVIAQSLEGGLTVPLSKKQSKALIETRLKFFTR